MAETKREGKLVIFNKNKKYFSLLCCYDFYPFIIQNIKFYPLLVNLK